MVRFPAQPRGGKHQGSCFHPFLLPNVMLLNASFEPSQLGSSVGGMGRAMGKPGLYDCCMGSPGCALLCIPTASDSAHPCWIQLCKAQGTSLQV